MLKTRFEIDGKELQPRERDALVNRFLINCVCFFIGVACWAGWLPAAFVWGAAAISLASLSIGKSDVFSVLQRLGIWILFISSAYEDSLSQIWQNVALLSAFVAIWSDTLWNFVKKRRNPPEKE